VWAQEVRTAAYLRVSTDEQADSGLGLDAQRTRVLGMAAAKGWAEPRLFVDEGISGTKDVAERPALAQLLEATRNAEIHAVIVLDLSRLARKTRLVLDLVEQITSHDVAFLSCKESLDTSTPQGQFVLTLFAALAQLERDQIAERTRAALAERGRRDGERGGRLPFGYWRSAQGIQADPERANVVRKIYRWHARGESLRTIAQKLNDAGVPGPTGSTWKHTAVNSILHHRSTYQGALRGDSPVPWPVILLAGSPRSRAS
jgi:site-specific DNA recombinase